MHRPIYLMHIPKTGGTSLYFALKDENIVYHGHDHILKHVRPSQLFKYWVVAFVRNPWDRLVSLFFYISKETNPIHPYSKIKTNEYYAKYKGDFQLFIDDFAKGRVPYRNLYKPQVWHIRSTFHKQLPHFIGRFENLQKDFDYICNVTRIPNRKLPVTRTSKHKYYMDYYNERSIKIVEKIYKEDIEAFGYGPGENSRYRGVCI